MHVCVYACMNVCMHVCMYLCTHVAVLFRNVPSALATCCAATATERGQKPKAPCHTAGPRVQNPGNGGGVDQVGSSELGIFDLCFMTAIPLLWFAVRVCGKLTPCRRSKANVCTYQHHHHRHCQQHCCCCRCYDVCVWGNIVK